MNRLIHRNKTGPCANWGWSCWDMRPPWKIKGLRLSTQARGSRTACGGMRSAREVAMRGMRRHARGMGCAYARHAAVSSP